MTVIYEYLDYRKFLKEALQEKKKTAKHFSHRFIHQKLGVAQSSGFMANVLSGKKNLTLSQALKLAKLFGLKGAEITYFENLVLYNHSKSIEEKNNYLKRLVNKQSIKLKKLNKSQFNLFSKWHHVFIHELISFFPVSDNLAEVGKILSPPVTEKEVGETLEVLEKLKMIQKDSRGVYQQTGNLFSTGDEVHSLTLAKFQLQTMDMGKRALETVPQKERDVSFVSVAVSKDGFQQIKDEIAKFRKRLLKISEGDREPDSVYQCNFQIFPVVSKRWQVK